MYRVAFAAVVGLAASTAFADQVGPTWNPWSEPVLAAAKAERRFVILDLEAVWCHWCHVMETTTYADSNVRSLIASKYVAIRVDQDANPDLAVRYGDWGWPATIIFSPDGSELVKRRGYIPPANMASLLQAVIDDPTPGPSVFSEAEVVPSTASHMAAATRQLLERRVTDSYDVKNAGWGDVHKFIDTDNMDWALRQAEHGNARAAGMAKNTLSRAAELIDPIWGGIYQYSDAADWSSPHFEKIMWYQANGLRQYSFCFSLLKDAECLSAAEAIYRFLTTQLLSSEGAFYCSQDADVDETFPGKTFYHLSDAERRRVGRAPSIDTHIYARENGWAISGLIAFANATGRTEPLLRAEVAAEWIVQHRRHADSTFAHGDNDGAVLSLAIPWRWGMPCSTSTRQPAIENGLLWLQKYQMPSLALASQTAASVLHWFWKAKAKYLASRSKGRTSKCRLHDWL